MISMLDIVIVLVLLGSIAYGVWKGFVRIAVGVAGLLLSLALSLRLAEQGPVWFPEVFKSDHLARAAALAMTSFQPPPSCRCCSWGYCLPR
jgi:uncharacterized membrane protein required for colicin V production